MLYQDFTSMKMVSAPDDTLTVRELSKSSLGQFKREYAETGRACIKLLGIVPYGPERIVAYQTFDGSINPEQVFTHYADFLLSDGYKMRAFWDAANRRWTVGCD